MHDEDPELAAFQACLLEVLHRHVDATAILSALEQSEATRPFRDYIDGFEPEMLEVAAILVKKWGQKRFQSTEDSLSGMPH